MISYIKKKLFAVNSSSGGGSGTITGSGTTGTIPKFSSATALGDSIITEDNGAIGINNTGFTATLAVREKAAATGLSFFQVANFANDPSFDVSENGVTVLQNRPGDIISIGAELSFGPIADVVLTGTTSNLDTSGSSVVTLSATGAQSLTGILAPTQEGTIKYIHNIDGADTITLKHNVTSTAANRFLFSTAADISLPPGNVLQVIYVGARWRNVRGV